MCLIRCSQFKEIICVGTIISPMHILTLAQCFDDKQNTLNIHAEGAKGCAEKYQKGWTKCRRRSFLVTSDEVRIKTFTDARDDDPVGLTPSWLEIHPLYDGIQFNVAVVGLEGTLQMSPFILPICLPRLDEDQEKLAFEEFHL